MFFTFGIDELQLPPERFRVLHPRTCDQISLVAEAARLFYFGRGGWQEAWPLTFTIKTESGAVVIRAHVYILSSQPHFDVVPAHGW